MIIAAAAIAVLAKGCLELQQHTPCHRRAISTVKPPSALLQEMLAAQRASSACTSPYQLLNDTPLAGRSPQTNGSSCRSITSDVSQTRRSLNEVKQKQAYNPIESCSEARSLSSVFFLFFPILSRLYVFSVLLFCYSFLAVISYHASCVLISCGSIYVFPTPCIPHLSTEYLSRNIYVVIYLFHIIRRIVHLPSVGLLCHNHLSASTSI